MSASQHDPSAQSLPAHVPAEVRAAREESLSLLRDHFAHDRLTVEEFEHRLTAAYQATTPEELDALTADLPAPSGATHSVPERVEATVRNVAFGGSAVVPSYLELRAVVGNVELSLGQARFTPGITEIDLRAVLSNIEIRLPAHIRVENNTRSVLGSFKDPEAPTEGIVPSGNRTYVVRLTGRSVLSNITLVRE